MVKPRAHALLLFLERWKGMTGNPIMRFGDQREELDFYWSEMLPSRA